MDHIQNGILWIHDPKRFLTTDSKRVNTASGNSKQFLYIQQLFDNTIHLYGHFKLDAWIEPGIKRFIGMVKSQYKQDLHCRYFTRTNRDKTATQLRRGVWYYFTFPVDLI